MPPCSRVTLKTEAVDSSKMLVSICKINCLHVDKQSNLLKFQALLSINSQYILINNKKPFCARSQNCEKGLLASSCMSVRMEQLGSQQKDFCKILHLSILRKSVEKI
jgi:hypothetical protein